MRKRKNLTLSRTVAEILRKGHPWVFRDKLGDARGLADGDWLHLIDPEGESVGTGMYQGTGGVAVRVFRRGSEHITVEWVRQGVNRALERRSQLRAETDAFRAINGESDGFPGIVVDVYSTVAVLQTYAPGLDALGRYVGGLVLDRLGLLTLLWKAPSKRVGNKGSANRVLRGPRPYVVRFQEGPLKLAADLVSGQKSGTYLDLRGLRRYLLELDLTDRKVLNLFSYTGAAGLACAQAGAREVVNVDQAQPSLDFGARYYDHSAMKWVQADIFSWTETIAPGEYDLIVVDPPSMASNKGQVPKALNTYQRIYSNLAGKVKPGGIIVACCCTSRISTREFEQKVGRALGPWKRLARLPMEVDHKPGFQEADYLKVMVYQKPLSKSKADPRKSRKRRSATGRTR